MTTTDTEQLVREAVVAILAGDATLQTLVGRAGPFVADVDADQFALALPCLVYTVTSYDSAAGRATVDITALAAGANAAATCRALLERVAVILTAPAFKTANGVPVAVADGVRRPTDPDFREALAPGTPDLQAATWSLPLWVCDLN